ncbi:MAG: hypothetical protein U5K28_10300 [Halobacteriales archaeon]|nr:hypothetical protein [Halobacteriales archaeon]
MHDVRNACQRRRKAPDDAGFGAVRVNDIEILSAKIPRQRHHRRHRCHGIVVANQREALRRDARVLKPVDLL